MSSVTRKVRVEGRVQGVWYRGWTVDKAKGLGLSGWVRNRRDGSVEAVFRGSETAVAEMLRLCGEGPPAAHVTGVTVTDIFDPVEDCFVQLRTE